MRNKPTSTASGNGTPPRERARSSVAIGFVTGMLAGPAAHGVDFTASLARAEIDRATLADPLARVPLKNYAALYNALVQQLGDEGFMLFSVPLRLDTFEFLCRGMLSSATLAEALDRGARFLRLVLPDLGVSIARGDNTASIVITEACAVGEDLNDPRRVFAFEWLLRMLHSLACWLVGRELSLGSVHFPYSQPAHFADYTLIYTPNSIFGAERLIASFNANLLDLPILQDDSALEHFLDGAPGKITMLYRRDRDTVHHVRDLMAKAFPESLSLEDAARDLHLSPRSLHRRLAEEDSSFRTIKSALRRDIALSQIEKTDLPIATIAANLGFAEPSTFFRAFQGWTGMAPSDYRSRIVNAKPRK